MDAEYEALSGITILGDSTIVVLDLDSAMDAEYEALLKKTRPGTWFCLKQVKILLIASRYTKSKKSIWFY